MGCLSNVLWHMLQVQLWDTLQGIGILLQEDEKAKLVVAPLNGEAWWGHIFARQSWRFCQESEESVECYVPYCPLFSVDASDC